MFILVKNNFLKGEFFIAYKMNVKYVWLSFVDSQIRNIVREMLCPHFCPHLCTMDTGTG